METTTPPTVPTPSPKSKWKKRLFISFGIIFLLFIAYVFICGLSFSEGSRTGVVIKVSKKGFLFKTYEGELNLGGFSQGDGTIMNKNVWVFSIQKNDTAIYNQITRSQGKQIRLYYKEVYKNFYWQADTPYFIVKTEVVH